MYSDSSSQVFMEWHVLSIQIHFFYEAGSIERPRPPRPSSQSPSGPLQKMLNISNHFVVLNHQIDDEYYFV